MSNAKIMVVEDEYLIADDIRITLENLGYEVPAIALSAEAAIEKVEEVKPDLVLIDIVLKGEMDGIEAAEQIRSRFGIPVVYLTAYSDNKKLERAKLTEPFGYLIKPYKEEEIKSAIEIALFKAEMEMKLRQSEEKYRSLFESTDASIYLIDRNMRFLYANRTHMSRHGLSIEEITGLEYKKCHSPVRTKEFSEKVKQVIESNSSVAYEHESEKDGKVFLRTLSPVADPLTGEVTEITVISNDITERKQAEQALREEHSKLELKLEQEMLMADIASNFSLTDSFHEAMDKVLGKIGETYGSDCVCFYKLYDNCEAAVKLSHWRSNAGAQKIKCPRTLSASEVPDFFRILKENKSIIVANSSELEQETKKFFTNQNIHTILQSPLCIAGQLRGFISCCHSDKHIWKPEEINFFKTVSDMIVNAWERDSQLKARLEAEKKRAEAIQVAEKAFRLASLGIMAGGITHEINQPLSVIRAAADSIILWNKENMSILPDDLSKNLKKVSGNINRIDKIVRQMRTFVYTPNQTMAETLDLNEVIEEALSLISQQLFSHGIELDINLCKQTLTLRGNRIHLNQVLINLAVNSMQALDLYKDKGRGKKVIINSIKRKEMAVVEVRDNGPGIPARNKDNIFDPLFTTKDSSEGMGLGLAISKQFVEGMGGAIQARNNKTGGATFTMRLPLHKIS